MLLCEKDNIYSIDTSDLSSLFLYFPVPENEIWRIDLLKELLDSRLDVIEFPGFSRQEIDELINFVCIS